MNRGNGSPLIVQSLRPNSYWACRAPQKAIIHRFDPGKSRLVTRWVLGAVCDLASYLPLPILLPVEYTLPAIAVAQLAFS